MSLSIIRYEPKYQAAVIHLWKTCKLVVPQNDPAVDIQKKLEFQPELFFLAVMNGHVLGSVMVGYEGHRGWLNYVAVLPEWQKKGYGRQLVEKAIAELRKLGCVKVNLQVRKSNGSVVRFYKHLGFQEEDRVSLGMKL